MGIGIYVGDKFRYLKIYSKMPVNTFYWQK